MIFYQEGGRPPNNCTEWHLQYNIEIPVKVKPKSIWDRIKKKKDQVVTLSQTMPLFKKHDKVFAVTSKPGNLSTASLHVDEEGWDLIKHHTVRVIRPLFELTENERISLAENSEMTLYQSHPLRWETSTSEETRYVNRFDRGVKVRQLVLFGNVVQLEFFQGSPVFISCSTLDSLIEDNVLRYTQGNDPQIRTDVFSSEFSDLSEFS